MGTAAGTAAPPVARERWPVGAGRPVHPGKLPPRVSAIRKWQTSFDHLIGALGASAANLSFVLFGVISPDYADSAHQPREARQHPDDE